MGSGRAQRGRISETVKSLFLCVLLCLLSACASTGAQPEQATDFGIKIEGMIIQNQLVYPVTDVMVEVPSTGGFAGCGNILPRTRCSTSFPAADYRGNAVLVRWAEYGEAHSTDEFVIKVPKDMAPGSIAWLEVIVFARGQAGARLISNPRPWSTGYVEGRLRAGSRTVAPAEGPRRSGY